MTLTLGKLSNNLTYRYYCFYISGKVASHHFSTFKRRCYASNCLHLIPYISLNSSVKNELYNNFYLNLSDGGLIKFIKRLFALWKIHMKSLKKCPFKSILINVVLWSFKEDCLQCNWMLIKEFLSHLTYGNYKQAWWIKTRRTDPKKLVSNQHKGKINHEYHIHSGKETN